MKVGEKGSLQERLKDGLQADGKRAGRWSKQLKHAESGLPLSSKPNGERVGENALKTEYKSRFVILKADKRAYICLKAG